ncbi:MAG TPA: S-layer homology domain-containing protein [Acidimicrobiia bacterium]|nr:S-layer homology domain-containing protein [Acidimicrobiia bacterium]
MRRPRSRRLVGGIALTVLAMIPLGVMASHTFGDVPDSNVFHEDIDWLADSGVTKGCNPPENTLFCPSDNVTREQMAAFLHRLAANGVVDAGSLNGMTADEIIAEAETDATKFISLNVFSNPDINFTETAYSDLNDAGVGGINLDVDYNFTLPPDYTPGTPLTVRLLAYSRTASTCNGDLSSNSVTAWRAGSGQVGSTSLTPADIPMVFTGDDVPEEYFFTIASSNALQPGDAVTFGIFGLAAAPRCELIITGAAVYYE